jgi:hypothetical protein
MAPDAVGPSNGLMEKLKKIKCEIGKSDRTVLRDQNRGSYLGECFPVGGRRRHSFSRRGRYPSTARSTPLWHGRQPASEKSTKKLEAGPIQKLSTATCRPKTGPPKNAAGKNSQRKRVPRKASGGLKVGGQKFRDVALISGPGQGSTAPLGGSPKFWGATPAARERA